MIGVFPTTEKECQKYRESGLVFISTIFIVVLPPVCFLLHFVGKCDQCSNGILDLSDSFPLIFISYFSLMISIALLLFLTICFSLIHFFLNVCVFIDDCISLLSSLIQPAHIYLLECSQSISNSSYHLYKIWNNL